MNTRLNFRWEIQHGLQEGRWVAGIDEVGRGPIAGPVVAAAVVFPPSVIDAAPRFLEQVNDSKKLTASKRETLACAIRAQAFVALGAASVARIEQHNILQASLQAMQHAYARLCATLERARGRSVDACIVDACIVDACIVDGNHIPRLVPAPAVTTPIVRGDAQSLTIACASIVAKVARDRLMQKLHARYPRYAWCDNKGYPVARHLEALAEVGLSPHHRKTFAPCLSCLAANKGSNKE